MIFKISKTIYGLQIHINLFNYDLWVRIHKNYLTEKTLGIRNNVPAGRVPFWDYDNILLEFLIPEIKYLQKQHKLSDIYIFRSSQKPNSYHAICLDILTIREWISILNESSVDEYYKTMPLTNDYKGWVLRITKKKDSVAPRLIKIITSPHQNRKKSKAHWLFLKYHYGLKKTPSNLDNNNKLYTTTYNTLNYLTKKMETKKYKKSTTK